MRREAAISFAADIVAVVDEGLGNSSYVVGLGDGRALGGPEDWAAARDRSLEVS
jgi:hypothetical protein